MRVSERAKSRYHNVDVEVTSTERGFLIQKRTTAVHPVERVYGLLGRSSATDDLIEEIRGR